MESEDSGESFENIDKGKDYENKGIF